MAKKTNQTIQINSTDLDYLKNIKECTELKLTRCIESLVDDLQSTLKTIKDEDMLNELGVIQAEGNKIDNLIAKYTTLKKTIEILEK